MNAIFGTRFTQLLGLELPIVQTGMGWVAGSHLARATSSAGGLGMIASATMSRPQLEAAIRRVVGLQPKPFGVNLRPDAIDLVERIELIGKYHVPIASFAGPPTKETVQRVHDQGALVMPTVGAARHAEKMASIGVDAVIAQGAEGGGHTGSVPTSLLVPAVVQAVGADIPVLAAGGISTGRGLVAALAWGADGVAMGTRFLLTKDSRVPDEVKRRYLEASVTDTVVTTAIDGKPQRVIRTAAVDRMQRAHLTRLPRSLVLALRFRAATGASVGEMFREGLAIRRSEGLSPSQVLMAANAPMMTKTALVDGELTAGVLPTGQVVGLIDELPSVAELFDRIVAEARSALAELSCMANDETP